jgi:nitroreductase
VVIVACAELGVSGYHEAKPAVEGEPAPEKDPVTDKGDWFMFDVALAVENLVLAAQSLGLATVHIGSFDAKKAASILEVPDGFCVVEMIPLGYPDQQRDPRPRKELSEIVFHDRFGVR